MAWRSGRGVGRLGRDAQRGASENAPTASDLRQGIFRQHRPKGDITPLSDKSQRVDIACANESLSVEVTGDTPLPQVSSVPALSQKEAMKSFAWA